MACQVTPLQPCQPPAVPIRPVSRRAPSRSWSPCPQSPGGSSADTFMLFAFFHLLRGISKVPPPPALIHSNGVPSGNTAHAASRQVSGVPPLLVTQVLSFWLRNTSPWGFPGGPGVKSLPTNVAWDAGSVSGPGGSHLPGPLGALQLLEAQCPRAGARGRTSPARRSPSRASAAPLPVADSLHAATKTQHVSKIHN